MSQDALKTQTMNMLNWAQFRQSHPSGGTKAETIIPTTVPRATMKQEEKMMK